MAICEDCKGEMLQVAGCDVTHFDNGKGSTYARIKYGDKREEWGGFVGGRCGDCGCLPGNYHHVGCDIERCPICLGQLISCDCPEWDGEGDDGGDDAPG